MGHVSPCESTARTHLLVGQRPLRADLKHPRELPVRGLPLPRLVQQPAGADVGVVVARPKAASRLEHLQRPPGVPELCVDLPEAEVGHREARVEPQRLPVAGRRPVVPPPVHQQVPHPRAGPVPRRPPRALRHQRRPRRARAWPGQGEQQQQQQQVQQQQRVQRRCVHPWPCPAHRRSWAQPPPAFGPARPAAAPRAGCPPAWPLGPTNLGSPLECCRRVNSGGECGAPRGRGAGIHGVRGDSGGVSARRPGFSQISAPRARPSPPVFTLRKHSLAYSLACLRQCLGSWCPQPKQLHCCSPPATRPAPAVAGGGGA